jgi:N4-(beta-N-acetylglucosaminyl)-L-asparaginase
MSRLRRAAVAALAAAAAAAAPAPARAGWVVMHTWPWSACADAAAASLARGSTALDAVVAGAAVAEADPAIDSVGRGAHPDAAGEVTLDALLMDGDSANIGAVGALRSVAGAAAAARLVLEHSTHSLLVGRQASDFAAAFGGLPLESLSSASSDDTYARWQDAGCQVRVCACTSARHAVLSIRHDRYVVREGREPPCRWRG